MNAGVPLQEEAGDVFFRVTPFLIPRIFLAAMGQSQKLEWILALKEATTRGWAHKSPSISRSLPIAPGIGGDGLKGSFHFPFPSHQRVLRGKKKKTNPAEPLMVSSTLIAAGEMAAT